MRGSRDEICSITGGRYYYIFRKKRSQKKSRANSHARAVKQKRMDVRDAGEMRFVNILHM